MAVLLAVSIVVFLAVYAVGDPVELLINPQSTELEREMMVRTLGLDRPVWMQYLTFSATPCRAISASRSSMANPPSRSSSSGCRPPSSWSSLPF
jgi:peptide/nickel transport system permease protein